MNVLAPTIDLARAAATPWDAIVAGAGPAGAFAALGLARAGHATLLVERKSFPRHKVCGGCLNAHAIEVLSGAGLAGELRAQGARTLSAIHLHHAGRAVDLPLPPGVAISRAALDTLLARAAIDAGAAFLPDTAALVLPEGDTPWRDGERRVRLLRHDGTGVFASARVLVVADGLSHSSLRECAAFRSRVSASARIGVGGLARSKILAVASGAITMAIGRDGYVGMTAVEQDDVNIAAAVDPGALKALGGPAGAVRAILAEAGIVTPAGLDDIDWHGTVPLTRRIARPVARRIFVIGDAAGYVEPFTGEGMAWALSAAELVVPLAALALTRWDGTIEADWLAAHRLAVGRQQRWCRAVARGLRHPLLVRAFFAALRRRPGLARPLMAHLTPRAPAP